MEKFSLSWMTDWQRIVNEDGKMSSMAKHFRAKILFKFGNISYIVHVKSGCINKIIAQCQTKSKGKWDFALEGPLDMWENFVEKIPPPKYHSIWALVDPTCHKKPLKIKGNVKLLWQNIRAFTRMLDLMREVH